MHTTEFPVSTPLMIVWVICLAALAFFFVRFLKGMLRKNNRSWLLGTFVVLLALGAAIHVVILSKSGHTVTEGNWVQLVLVSLVASLEMFIGHTVIFDDIIAAVVFHEPGLMLLYLSVFVQIVAFSCVLVFQILPRRMKDRLWLQKYQKQADSDRKNHIFVGVSPSAKLLAKSILRDWEQKEDKSGQGTVMFIDLPDKDKVHAEISLGDIFASLISRRKELSLDEELGSDRFALLKGQNPITEEYDDLVQAIGLRRLRPWLRNARSSIYFLGGEADNVHLLDLLLKDKQVRAKVFCLADRSSDTQAVYSAARGRVRLIDTHFLSVQQLKFLKPELHPIHFVDVAKGKDGEPLGYVSSGFHAMSVGFRATGQEALRFLYEFGSFVGKDRRRVPTAFDIFDDDLELHRGDFLNHCPGLRTDPTLVWNEGPVGGERFWQRYEEILPALNYVVIATGDPERNVELAAGMMQTAARLEKDMSRFVILVRVEHLDERTSGVLALYNQMYHCWEHPVLRPFGMADDIWNLSAISGKGMKEQASRFYAGFQQAIGGDDTWDARKKRLSAREGDPHINQMELLRRQAQDLSISAFLPTLKILAGDNLKEAAALIPSDCGNGHYPVKGPEAEHLEYLAIQERIRWCVSHLASGYVPGVRDELLMRMDNMVPYDQIRDPKVQHYDWITVKTALSD